MPGQRLPWSSCCILRSIGYTLAYRKTWTLVSYQDQIIHKWITTVRTRLSTFNFSKGRRADSRKVVWEIKRTELRNSLRNTVVNSPEITMWSISEKVFFVFSCWLLTEKPQTHSLFRLIRSGLYSVGCHNNNKFLEKIWTLLRGARVFYNI